MDFKTFKLYCKYRDFTFKKDSHCEFEPICKRQENISVGKTFWGVCDEEHCHLFGMKHKDLV